MMMKNEISENFHCMSSLYSALEDDISKGIFLETIKNNITKNNFSGLKNYLSQNLRDSINSIDSFISEINIDKSVVLYGAGGGGRWILNKILAINPTLNISFCDKAYEQIQFIEGIEVISPEKLVLDYREELIIICSGTGYNEIYDFLIFNNVPSTEIYAGIIIDEKNQYFDPIIKLSEKEVFLDVGGYDGGTTTQFLERVNGQYSNIYI